MKHKVRNLREGSRSGNWIQHWKDATGITDPGECHNVDCHEKATVGGHVQRVDANDNTWYIVPICQSCNCQRGAEMTVEGPLVGCVDPSNIIK